MQKPKNLLPGLFLCVFSRILEPLVDFYCSNLLAFPPFLFGADFFAGKKGVYGPFYTGPFCTPIPRKAPRAPRRLSTRFYFAQSAPTKWPLTKTPGASSTPKRAFVNTHPKGSAHAAPLQRGSIWHAAAPHERPPRWRAPNRLKNDPFGALYRKPCLVCAHKKPQRKGPAHAETPPMSQCKNPGREPAPQMPQRKKPRE